MSPGKKEQYPSQTCQAVVDNRFFLLFLIYSSKISYKTKTQLPVFPLKLYFCALLKRECLISSELLNK